MASIDPYARHGNEAPVTPDIRSLSSTPTVPDSSNADLGSEWGKAVSSLDTDSQCDSDDLPSPDLSDADEGDQGAADAEAIATLHFLVNDKYHGSNADEWDMGLSPPDHFAFYHRKYGTRHWAAQEDARAFICGRKRSDRYKRGFSQAFAFSSGICRMCVYKADHIGILDADAPVIEVAWF